MHFIIHPIFIYLLQVVSVLQGVFGWLAFFAWIAMMVFLIWRVVFAAKGKDVLDDKSRYPEIMKMTTKYFKVSAVLFVCLFIAAVITPSKNTMIGMYVASVATVENITNTYNFAKVEAKDLANYTKDYMKDVLGFVVSNVNMSVTNTLNALPIQAKFNLTGDLDGKKSK